MELIAAERFGVDGACARVVGAPGKEVVQGYGSCRIDHGPAGWCA